jgi:hypothetical protein
MTDPSELKSLRKRVEKLQADGDRWWATAPATRRNRDAARLLLEARTLVLTAIVAAMDADAEAAMLRDEVAERDAGIPRPPTQ